MTAPYDFKALITANKEAHAQMAVDYDAYCGKGLPISSRTLSDSTKINNKIPNDFRGEIVDQITGYLFGRPITYSLDKERYGADQTRYDADNAELDAFLRRTEYADLDAEAGKRASIMGSVFRLCYIDEEGALNVSNLFAWQVVWIDDHAAFLYEQDAETSRYTITLYDDLYISTYQENDEGEFEPIGDAIPHMFKLMPIIEIVNNDERLPDFRKVEPLIDAYDRTLSDAQNEIEEFRQAYMKFVGADPPTDPDDAAKLRASGSIGLPEGGDVGFVTKQVDDDFLEHHKQTLRENIYRFSSTVDMTDQKFSGADQSGEARKWKLLALENKAAIKERKFAKGLHRMFKVLSTAWTAKGFTLDWEDIKFRFDRNIPLELLMEADIATKLRGNVSERTRLSLLSFVDDVEREIEEMEQEQAVDLDRMGFDDNREDDDNSQNDGDMDSED